MTIEIKVPILPESVTDATVAKWYKKAGDTVERDENLVDLETDKVMLEVPAPKSGVLKKIVAEEGSVVTANVILAVIAEGAGAEEAELAKEPSAEKKALQVEQVIKPEEVESKSVEREAVKEQLSPSVRRIVAEKEIDVDAVSGSGKGGRVTKQDVEDYLQRKEKKISEERPTSSPTKEQEMFGPREEKRVPMTRLRKRIAERLVEAQHNAAMLTTFNEVNMKPVMDLRSKYKDSFEKKHGIRLGFMSFFTKAAVEALKRFPAVNASIDGDDLIYHNYCDIGIAIGSPRGLVVPILRNAEMMSMSEIEQQIKDYASKAESGKLAIEDMTGGTFTITNGGVYGSLLSTPIINPPQSGILGMHNIVDRPVIENGEIVIRPIMYVAFSYDHRVIDGRESVRFLYTIKEMIEDPARLLLEV